MPAGAALREDAGARSLDRDSRSDFRNYFISGQTALPLIERLSSIEAMAGLFEPSHARLMKRIRRAHSTDEKRCLWRTTKRPPPKFAFGMERNDVPAKCPGEGEVTAAAASEAAASSTASTAETATEKPPPPLPLSAASAMTSRLDGENRAALARSATQ